MVKTTRVVCKRGETHAAIRAIGASTTARRDELRPNLPMFDLTAGGVYYYFSKCKHAPSLSFYFL